MSNNLCKKCFFYGEPRCSYQYNTNRDVDICKYFKEIPQHLLGCISASPEVLEETLVCKITMMDKAIAATVEKPKEVEK
jgi:hypothetical protein